MICTCWSQQVSLCKVLNRTTFLAPSVHTCRHPYTPLIKCMRRRVSSRLSFISSALLCTPVLLCDCAWEQHSTGSAGQLNAALNMHFFFLQGAGRARMCVCVCLVHWILHWLQRARSATVNLSTLNLSDLSPCACIHTLCMGLFPHVCTCVYT